MKMNIIVAGLGGQGVIYLTRLLAKAAIIDKHSLMVSESHGMSQRGGSVVSHLKVGGNKAPLIQRGTADLLISLDPDEAVRNLPFLRRGATVLVNSEDGLMQEVSEQITRLEIQVFSLPANRMAIELGSPAVANVIMLGLTTANPLFELNYESILVAIDIIGSNGKELNIKAFEAGFNSGKEKYLEYIYSPSKNSK
ncbi:MAG: indolepyruvate oxidoreductase subunit beta [Chloroflexi bacterium]|nr:indolepyruvate oxidoreductase subunit beta [Chloroflexota bacterium]